MRLLLPLTMVAAVLPAQQPADPAWELTLRLSQVKRKVRTLLANQPDYTCLATFDRYRWLINEPAERKLDTVRVEVAYVGGRELYSWPGEGRFSETRLSQMVGMGMMGDGDFAVHAHNLFVGNAGTEKFAGEEQLGGRQVWRWNYRISSYQSAWSVQHGDFQQIVGSEGSFWADAETLDLVKMETHATDFLPGFPLKEVVSRVQYGNVRIGERDVLLPVQAELSTTAKEGTENRNHTEYSNCRQYAGQSTISFGDLPEPEAPSAAPVQASAAESQLPAGLVLRIRLPGELKLARISVGTPLEGVLDAALRQGTKQIAPKGATVRGRVRLLTRDNGEFSELGLIFDELEFAGHVESFSASLRGFETIVPGVHMTMTRNKTSHAVGDDIGTVQQVLGASRLNGASVFFVEAQVPGLPKGTIMTWVTSGAANGRER